jgi:hypothetical protein
MIELLIGCALVGFLVWLLVTYIPMPQPVRVAIVVLAAVWIVLRLFPLLGYPLP